MGNWQHAASEFPAIGDSLIGCRHQQRDGPSSGVQRVTDMTLEPAGLFACLLCSVLICFVLFCIACSALLATVYGICVCDVKSADIYYPQVSIIWGFEDPDIYTYTYILIDMKQNT